MAAGVINVQRMVHLSSASMYPLFAWLRGSPSERRAFEGRTFLRVWSLAAIAGTLLLGSQYFSPYTFGIRLSTDLHPAYVDHHEQEILLASMAAERAGDPTGPLLLVASQRGEA
jgi:hypothetical protein